MKKPMAAAVELGRRGGLARKRKASRMVVLCWLRLISVLLNLENLFTGWKDPDLTETGDRERPRPAAQARLEAARGLGL